MPEGYNFKTLSKFVDRIIKKFRVNCIDLLQLHCPPKEICSKKELYEMMDEFVKLAKYLTMELVFLICRGNECYKISKCQKYSNSI